MGLKFVLGSFAFPIHLTTFSHLYLFCPSLFLTESIVIYYPAVRKSQTLYALPMHTFYYSIENYHEVKMVLWIFIVHNSEEY
jgi:hypothetical protein